MSRSNSSRLAVASITLAGCLLAADTPAATINVPADQPTIQAGIDAAAAGDTVLVAPGTFNEALVISARTDLTISGSGALSTTVLAPGQGPAFNVLFSTAITITGFRISSMLPGGDSRDIGGIRVLGSRPVRIFKNLLTQHASNGIIMYGSDVEAWNNVIVYMGDDGIRMEEDASVPDRSMLIAYNNTIAGNRTATGVGVFLRRADESAILFNNILYDNDYNIGLQEASSCLHDYNLISTTGMDFYGSVTRAANEPDCDPGFIDLPALDFHIPPFSCAEDVGTAAFSGESAATDDFDGQPRPLGAAHEMGADEIFTCAVQLLAPPPDVVVCAGDSTDIDAGAATTFNCSGGSVDYEWTDGAGGSWTTQVITVSPTTATDYSLTVSCSGDPPCLTRDTVRVDVEEPPTLFAGAAVDRDPCDLGIDVSWAATFPRSGSGTYTVYRSSVSCTDALAQPAISSGLVAPGLFDATTTSFGSYYYVIEAEESMPARAPCAPIGPGGGLVARLCIGPTVDADGAAPPAGVYAALRARHVGDFVTMLWPIARALLPGEHFHLYKTVDEPTNPFGMINPELDLTLLHDETDLSSWIQFFDLRIANLCEVVSDREYPPGLP